MFRTAKIFLKLSIYTIILLCIIECQNSTKTKDNNNYQLHIGIDSSLKSITNEIINLFNYYNPKLILKIDYNKATIINNNFNDNYYDIIIIPKQKKYNWRNLSKLNIYPKEEMLFKDALVFITSSGNQLSNINIKNLNQEALKFNKLIFDANINQEYYKYLVELNPGIKNNIKIYSDTLNAANLLIYLNSNDLIVTNIAKIINNKKIENNFKILDINSKENFEAYIHPSKENLINNKYPLGIEVVAIYKDTSPYLARSFIDFSLGQISQLVIYKYGLLPRKIYRRVIEINNNAI